MSKVPVSLTRALSLASVAGLLIGCPAVEPELPEPAPLVPQSGVWGMHIASLDSDGVCARFTPDVEGRVIRLDIEADERGELYAEVLGLGLYGGHSEGFVWADAELGLPSFGWDEPVVLPEDQPEPVDETTEPVEAEAMDDDCIEPAEEESNEGAPGTAPPRVADETEDSDYGGETDCGEPRESEPEPSIDAGIYVALNAQLGDPGSMRGALTVTVSNGVQSCSWEADIDAAYLGQDVSFDDEDDIVIIAEDEPGHGAEPKETTVSTEDEG